MMHSCRCYGSLSGRPSWFTSWCFCMNGVAGQDPSGNHVGLLHSMPMGVASEVVPVGYNDYLSFDKIAKGRPSERL